MAQSNQRQLDLLEHHLLHSSSESEKSNDKKQEKQEKQEQQQKIENVQQPAKQDNNVQKSTKQNNNRKRYKYCCRKCKHTDRGKKSCVCVVPRTQRRTQIGDQGCQTCSCKGCSIQDFQYRGQDPQYHPVRSNNDSTRQNYHQQTKRPRQRSRDRKNRDSDNKNDRKFDAINGCCKNCMKAFSKNNKSCLCQVPKNVRKSKLPCEGCKICGCNGCNPRDRDASYSYSRSRQSVSSYNSSSQSRKSYDERQFRFNNMDRSNFGQIIIVEYGLNPGMLGLGIPQRTPSYILGKPQ